MSQKRIFKTNELTIYIKNKLINDYESKSFTQRDLSNNYNISVSTVSKIIKKKIII
jgi:hypothetical protein